MTPTDGGRGGFELRPATAVDYLQTHDVVPPDTTANAERLGGGVSNHVIRVTWENGCVVVKQPLPNLAVEDDWPADLTRVHNEATAARAYARILADANLDRTHVPDVVFETSEYHTVAMTCAPAGAANWKRELLDGRVDACVAATVGQALAAVHVGAAGDDDLRAAFESKAPFEQLRLDPYHRTTARRHPDVAEHIRKELERIRSVDRTLVHGDYSPKNVLVDRNGPNPETWILDFEVAHWGDPAFDAAFMLNHLFIKSVYHHGSHDTYVAAARRFWRRYREGVPWDCERETVRELAVLMLARVDGKSPVEYVDEGPVAEALRTVARDALATEVTTFDEFAALAEEVSEQL